MKICLKIMTGLGVVLVLIQFIHPAKNNGIDKPDLDITHVAILPVKAQYVLRTSCYDCHSNKTNYPWYANIQPLDWWLSSHIKEGKSELNFNEFGAYSKRRQLSKLKAIGESIRDGSMPLSSYLIMHKNAKLSEEDKQMIMVWAEKTRDSLSNIYHR